MAFGRRRGGEYKPLLKFDLKNGSVFTQDREQGETVQKNITEDFCAVIDFQGARHGWLNFPKGEPPGMVLFPLDQEDIGAPPGETWREGVRFEFKLDGENFWRECLSTAIGLWIALDVLHDEYLEGKPDEHMLPVIELVEMAKHIGRNGISFSPTFRIIDWVGRDAIPKRPAPPPQTATKVTAKPKPKPVKRGDMDDEIPF